MPAFCGVVTDNLHPSTSVGQCRATRHGALTTSIRLVVDCTIQAQGVQCLQARISS